jgi:hypothetical protein
MQDELRVKRERLATGRCPIHDVEINVERVNVEDGSLQVWCPDSVKCVWYDRIVKADDANYEVFMGLIPVQEERKAAARVAGQ